MRSAVATVVLALLLACVPAYAQEVPEVTAPVNDFAHVVDEGHAQSIDRIVRALQAASGDVIVVATVETYAPFGSLAQYANKLFENHGRGIGTKGKDNGALVMVAIKEHSAWIEVGYGLEPYITDGFAGETTRLYMIPEFRRNNYGAGLEAGVQRLAGRIAQARGITLDGVPAPQVSRGPRRDASPAGTALLMFFFFVVLIVVGVISSIKRAIFGPRRWGRGPFSGWNSGVGPFGGGWGGGFGGFGGGGGGGGFGGFGGGASGGGGGGGSW